MIGKEIDARSTAGTTGEVFRVVAKEAVSELAGALQRQAAAARTSPDTLREFQSLAYQAKADFMSALNQAGPAGEFVRPMAEAALNKAVSDLVSAATPVLHTANIYRDLAATAASLYHGVTVATLTTTVTVANVNISEVIVRDFTSPAKPPTGGYTISIPVPAYGNPTSSGGYGSSGGGHSAPSITFAPSGGSGPSLTFASKTTDGVVLPPSGGVWQPSPSAGNSGGGQFYPTWDGGGAELSPAVCTLLAAMAFQQACLFSSGDAPRQESAATPVGMPSDPQKTAAPKPDAGPVPLPVPESLDLPAHWYLPMDLAGATGEACVPAASVLHGDVPMRTFSYPTKGGPATLVFAADATRTGKPYEGAIATCTMTTNGVRLKDIDSANGFLIYQFESPESGAAAGCYYGLQWTAEIGPERVLISNPPIPEAQSSPAGTRLITCQVHGPTPAACMAVLEAFIGNVAASGRKVLLHREELPACFLRDARMDGTRLEAEVFNRFVGMLPAEVTVRLWPKTYDPARPASLACILPLVGGVNRCVFRLPHVAGAASIEIKSGKSRSLAFLQREIVPLGERTQVAEIAGSEGLAAGTLPLLGNRRGFRLSGDSPAIFVPFASVKRRPCDVSGWETLGIEGVCATGFRCAVQFIEKPEDIVLAAQGTGKEVAPGKFRLVAPLRPRLGQNPRLLGAVIQLTPSGASVGGRIDLEVRDLCLAGGPASREDVFGRISHGGMVVTLPAGWRIGVAGFTPLSSRAQPAVFFPQRVDALTNPQGWQVALCGVGGSGGSARIGFPAGLPVPVLRNLSGPIALSTGSGNAPCATLPVSGQGASCVAWWGKGAVPLEGLPSRFPIRLLREEDPVRAYAAGRSDLDPITALPGVPAATANPKSPAPDAPHASGEQLLADFSKGTDAVGTIGPKGMSVAKIVRGDAADANATPRLVIAAAPDAKSGGYGGGYVDLERLTGSPVAFSPSDVLRLDIRNLGTATVDLAIELKSPNENYTPRLVHAAARAESGWKTLEIPLSKCLAAAADPCSVICFVVTQPSRFEIDNLRLVKRPIAP